MEISHAQEMHQDAERSYGFDLPNLVAVKGYPKLLNNEAVKSYSQRHENEILGQLTGGEHRQHGGGCPAAGQYQLGRSQRSVKR